MTPDEERAENVIRAGVPVPAKDYTCVGCGDTVTRREPERPAGIYGTIVMVDDNGRAGKPVDVYAHPKSRCVGGFLRVLAGETDPEDEVPATKPTRIGRRHEEQAELQRSQLAEEPRVEVN